MESRNRLSSKCQLGPLTEFVAFSFRLSFLFRGAGKRIQSRNPLVRHPSPAVPCVAHTTHVAVFLLFRAGDKKRMCDRIRERSCERVFHAANLVVKMSVRAISSLHGLAFSIFCILLSSGSGLVEKSEASSTSAIAVIRSRTHNQLVQR